MENKIIRLAAVIAMAAAGTSYGWAGTGLESLKAAAGNIELAAPAPASAGLQAAPADAVATGKFLVPAGGAAGLPFPTYIYTAVFPTLEEAQKAMQTMVDALSSQGMLVTGRRVTGSDGAFLVQVEYAIQQTLNAYRYTSRPYVSKYEASQSMDEAKAGLKKAGLTILSYNVYATQEAPQQYYFAIGMLKNSRINIKEYADTDYASESIARRCMDDAVKALLAAGVPVLSYATEKTGPAAFGFRVDFFRGEMREILAYTADGFASEFEARSVMQEGVDSLAAAGAAVLGNHVEKSAGGIRIHVSFISGSLNNLSEYASQAFKDKSEARRAQDETVTNLRKAGVPVINYVTADGNTFPRAVPAQRPAARDLVPERGICLRLRGPAVHVRVHGQPRPDRRRHTGLPGGRGRRALPLRAGLPGALLRVLREA